MQNLIEQETKALHEWVNNSALRWEGESCRGWFNDAVGVRHKFDTLFAGGVVEEGSNRMIAYFDLLHAVDSYKKAFLLYVSSGQPTVLDMLGGAVLKRIVWRKLPEIMVDNFHDAGGPVQMYQVYSRLTLSTYAPFFIYERTA